MSRKGVVLATGQAAKRAKAAALFWDTSPCAMVVNTEGSRPFPRSGLCNIFKGSALKNEFFSTLP